MCNKFKYQHENVLFLYLLTFSKLKHELYGWRFYIWILDLINNRIGNLQIWSNHWCTLLHPNFNMNPSNAIYYKLVVLNSEMCFLLCFWIVICASQMKYLKFSFASMWMTSSIPHRQQFLRFPTNSFIGKTKTFN